MKEKEKIKKENSKALVGDKIGNFIEKYDKLFVLLFIICAIFIKFRNVAVNVDYIWNYANILKLCNGEVIYKDVNIIINPLFFEMGKWFLNIFGQNYYWYLIYQTIISIVFFVVVYKFLLTIKLRKKDAIIALFLIGYYTKYMGITLTVYISLSVIFLLLGLIFLIKRLDGKISYKKYIILESIFAILTFLAYQKTAVVFAVIILINELIFNKKKGFLNTIKIGLLCLIWLIGFVCILAINNNLNEYINIALLGMSSFTNNFIINSSIYYVAFDILLLISIFVLVKYLNKRGVSQYKDISIYTNLFIVSIASLIVYYPIGNDYHANVFLLFFTTYMVLSIKDFLSGLLIENKKYEKILYTLLYSIITIGMIVWIGIYIIFIPNKTDNRMTKELSEYSSVYKGLVLEKKDQKRILDIVNYIKEKKKENRDVKYLVLGDYSNAVSMYFGESHGSYDMFLTGNLGKNGEEILLNDLKEKDSTYIIIAKKRNKEEEEINIFQYIEEADDVTRNNYNKIDELDDFEIYYGKKEIVNENK